MDYIKILYDDSIDDDIAMMEAVSDLGDDHLIMNFERAFLITIFLFGVFMLWFFVVVMGNKESTPQPRTWIYEGDTVATEDDCREQSIREEVRKAENKTTPRDKSKKKRAVGPISQVPNEICLSHGIDDTPNVTSLRRDISLGADSIQSVMISVSEGEEEQSETENSKDSPV